jgi:glycerophosphoryl diester phosphodiesterase
MAPRWREIAHRGYAGRNPENTVAAVRAAAATADAVEVDVRRCADALVTCHDDTLDRLTDASGPVRERTAATLAATSVDGTEEGIPTLAAVLDAAPSETGFVLELKERGVAAEALDLAAAVENEVLVSSFDPGTLREARDADPDVPRALVVGGDAADPLATAATLDCAAVHVSTWRCLRTHLVPDAHDAGLDVAAWTVRARPVARLLDWRGADALIADVPLGRGVGSSA